MIIFIDLTDAVNPFEKIPLCAFFDVTNDRFIERDNKTQVFRSMYEIEYYHITTLGLVNLVPQGFFKRI